MTSYEYIQGLVEKHGVQDIFISLSTTTDSEGRQWYYCTYRGKRRKVTEQSELFVTAELAIKALRN